MIDEKSLLRVQSLELKKTLSEMPKAITTGVQAMKLIAPLPIFSV